MPVIAFATCSDYPELTIDDQLAVAELASRGARSRPWIWDSAPGEVPPCDAVIVRSCWDYHEKTAAFCAWIDLLAGSGLPVFNPPAVVTWNLDKRYLGDLAGRGVAIPKTLWVEAGSTATLRDLLSENGLEQAVVKPTVGMLGIDTWRTSMATAAAQQTEFAALVRRRAVMVQAFVAEVLAEGEVSLVFFGGDFSHAVRKRPAAGEFRIQREYGGTRHDLDPPAAWIQSAREVLAAVDAPLLYARVDAVPVGDQLVLMELELIDPFLFLGMDPQAPARFAEAVLGVLRR